jgi:hypothetical protein
MADAIAWGFLGVTFFFLAAIFIFIIGILIQIFRR